MPEGTHGSGVPCSTENTDWNWADANKYMCVHIAKAGIKAKILVRALSSQGVFNYGT